MTLDEMIQQVNENFGASFQKDGFELAYQFERPYPSLIRLGFLSPRLNMKLLFVHEWRTSLYVAELEKPFTDQSEWAYFERLVDFIQKRPMRWVENNNNNYAEFLKADLARVGNEFADYRDKIVPLFDDLVFVTKWKPEFDKYVDDEIQKKYNRTPRT